MKHFYTYKVTLPETGQFYIGRGRTLSEDEKIIISEKTKLGMTDEIKNKLSEFKKGKKFYTNGVKVINVLPGTEPEGFLPGRKLKNN